MRAFVIGFPKCGTSSINRALSESGFSPLHHRKGQVAVGSILYRNFYSGRPIFDGLEAYDAITQADACYSRQDVVFWPQLDCMLLRTIRKQNPGCRFILNTRDIEAHIRSISKWFDYRWHLVNAHIPGLPHGYGGEDTHLRRWILGHYANVRAWGFPYTEVRIDGPDAREQLSEAVGTEIKWWGVENAR